MAKLSQESITEANRFTERILSREDSLYTSYVQAHSGNYEYFCLIKAQSSKQEKEGYENI